MKIHILLIQFLSLILSQFCHAAFLKIELTPIDVSSTSSATFSTLPTANPSLFGLTGTDIRSVNFDTDPSTNSLSSGSILTNQYSSIGVTMNSVQLSSSVFGGAASSPNATFTSTTGSSQIFNFSVPVVAIGVINTSPDKDTVQLWSGQNASGSLLGTFIDQDGLSLNFNIDRFVGGRVTGGDLIGSVAFTNASGDIELDELIFEVTTIPEISNIALFFGIALIVLVVRKKHKLLIRF